MFEKGKVYKRREIHKEFGGNWQNGISNSKGEPYIFIFSGSSGGKYGYEDGWDNESIYWYSGEGQVGDQKFTRGNKAIRDHQANGKKILLFEKTKKSGVWRFEDEMSFLDYEYYISHDKNGDQRIAIRFHLVRSSNTNNFESYYNDEPNITERKGLVTSRVGQGIYREKLIDKWGKRCPMTHCDILPILIASHIKSWANSSPEERLDVENGILLSPNADALFDRHLISFEDNGQILIASQITEGELKKLGLSSDLKINVTDGMIKYLREHRNIFHSSNFT